MKGVLRSVALTALPGALLGVAAGQASGNSAASGLQMPEKPKP